MGAGAPADDFLERLRTWLDRLVSALTQIVANLSGARSFSISAGAISASIGLRRTACCRWGVSTTTWVLIRDFRGGEALPGVRRLYHITSGQTGRALMFEQPGVGPAIVLVHGAFADASHRNGVIERLQQQRYTVVVPANPASARIGLSRAASGTICRKRLRRPSPKPSSTSTATDR
jgi:hypothetical protein